MIKGRVREKITVEKVLERISEFEIFRHYVGHDFKPGKCFPSPFRQDRHPSFSIDQLNNGLYYTDWAAPNYRGDAIDFVRQLYTLTLPEALRRIDQDFGLGLFAGSAFAIRTAPMYKIPKLEERKPALIQFKGTQKFTRRELAYWEEYHQGAEDLKRENIFAVRSLFIDRQKISLYRDDLVYAYWAEDINKCKIYRPLANRDKKEWKWRSSVPITYVEGLSTIQGCEKAIVTKSKKDKMVLQKVFPFVCSVQNESVVALSAATVSWLKEQAKEVFINYDNDVPGVKSSWAVTAEFGFKHLNVPYDFLKEGIKDFADLAKKKGLQTVADYFTLKGLA